MSKFKIKKCAFCQNEFKQYNSLKKWCSSDCGYKLSQKLVSKDRQKKNRAAKKEFNLSDRSWLNKNISRKIQEISRVIDTGLPCLARGYSNCQIHGGHILTKGGHVECKWNLHNIHRQSAQSNTFQSDDSLMREKLALEYGRDYLDFILSLRGYPAPKLSVLELREVYENASKELLSLKKWLKHQNTPLSLKNRIILRNKINEKLNIYEDCQINFNI